MKNSNDLWDEIGSLPEQELFNVITKLFGEYEQRLKKDPQDRKALHFFQLLARAVGETANCNLNRR